MSIQTTFPTEAGRLVAPTPPGPWQRGPTIVLVLGLAALILPTLFDVAREAWSTEQGGGGPIIMMLAIWLGVREFRAKRPPIQPGSLAIGMALIVPLLMLYFVARVTFTIEVESFVMYAIVLVAAYMLVGLPAMKAIWFPLVFMLFAFPPPDTLFTMITQPIKIAISRWAVDIMYFFGAPAANTGVMIQIGQYQMLVAAACAGLNSLITLTALGLFYTYIRHNSNLPYMVGLIVLIVPIAVFVNLMRVLILLIITYYFGEAAGQGFVHDLAGLTMFTLALLTILGIDTLASIVLGERRVASRQRLVPA